MTRGMKKKARVIGYLIWISYSIAAIPGFWFDDLTVWGRTLVFTVLTTATYIIMVDKKEVDAEKDRQRESACRATGRH